MKKLICMCLACLMLAAVLAPAAAAEGGLVLAEGSHLVLGETYVEKIDGTVTVGKLKAEFAGDVDVAGKADDAAVATDDTVTGGADSLKALIYGDVNRDGKITVTDVTAMLKKIAAWDVDVNTDAADVDANKKLTVSDVTKMLKYLAGWDDISLGNVRMVFENAKVAAENENKNLDAFFSDTMVKKLREDLTGTGEYAYKMKLARNEYESCQFYLTTKEAYEGMTIDVAPFEYEFGGHTLNARIEREHYWEHGLFNNMNGDHSSVGGYMPEALVPNEAPFELKPENLQGFMITVKAEKDSPAGMYKSFVTVKDADGKEVKKAAVYAYVWDFTLPDTPYSASAFGLSWYDIYVHEHKTEGDDSVTYIKYYDFLLENNISAYDLPYGGNILEPRNEQWMSDPRVTSFCISEGTPSSWETFDFAKDYGYMKEAYEKLATNPDWLDKGYFYPVDEPCDLGVDRVRVQYERLRTLLGEDAYLNIVVPFAQDGYMTQDYQIKNIDYVEQVRPYITIWCPQSSAFGRQSEHYTWTPRAAQAKYGDFCDRYVNVLKPEAHKAWWYVCCAPEYPNPNYFMFYQGVGNRVVAWQQYMFQSDGILYWATTNNWGIIKLSSLNMDRAEFGYGDGTLLYPGYLFGLEPGPVASWRLYQVRDSQDDFDYMKLVENVYGRDEAMKIVNKVTTSYTVFTEDYRVMESARDDLAALLEGTDK